MKLHTDIMLLMWFSSLVRGKLEVFQLFEFVCKKHSDRSPQTSFRVYRYDNLTDKCCNAFKKGTPSSG